MSDDTRSSSSSEPTGRGLSHWLGQFLDKLGLRHGGSIREDITEALAQDGGGVTDLSPQERAMLSNVLSLRERRVADVMVPRADVIAVSSEATLGDLLALFRTAGHSRLPVYGESLDDPRGMIHIRDFLDFIAARAKPGRKLRGEAEAPPGPSLGAIDLSMTLAQAKILRPVLYVPPSMPAVDLLVRMQVREVAVQGGPEQEGSAALDQGLAFQQHPADVRVDDDRVGRTVGVLGARERAALQAVLGEGDGGLVGGLPLGDALHPDAEASLVHHDEHRCKTFIFFTNEETFSTVKVHDTSRRRFDPHFVFD